MRKGYLFERTDCALCNLVTSYSFNKARIKKRVPTHLEWYSQQSKIYLL